MDREEENIKKETSPVQKNRTTRKNVKGSQKAYFQLLFDAEERQDNDVALRDMTKDEKVSWYGRVGQWFQLLCFMHIPFFGFFYMLVLAIRKKTPPQKKSFAMAYVLYRGLVLLLVFTVIFIVYRVGLSFLEELLKYAGNLV